MLRNPPFIGNFPISQSFGDNPAQYAFVACGGALLRGHNGVDFATPLGTPVTAVQAGVVLDAREDPDRFGHFVLLGHEWGQTLYAHLAEARVTRGQQVTAGQEVGRSGNSGRSSGPHLHFGMRITPFSVADGWCGYVDPKPYLDRLTQPRGAVMGPHIIGGVHRHLDLLNRWQPRAILVLDPNPTEMALLREACPNAVIVGRVFEPDHDIEHRIRANPQEAARWADDKVMSRMSPHVDYWQFANEVLQAGDGLPLLNAFELARMELAEASGYKCAILAFSVGNPDLPENDRMAMWRLVYPAIERAERNGHVVAIHQYGAPDLFSPAQDWYAFRLEHQVLRRLPYKKVQFIITEYGVDGLIDGRPQPTGWQGFTSAENYVEQLLRAGAYLERFSGRIAGYNIFTLGHNMPWGTYDIAGPAADLLAERSDRGTWGQVNTAPGGIAPGESDQTIDPGGTAGGGGQPPPEPEPTEPTEPEPEPTEPEEPAPTRPVVEQRITLWFEQANMRIRASADRPDRPTGELVYVVKDIFTTRNGSWEPSPEPAAIPQWARDAYLAAEFLEAGADHHLFARVLDLDGNPIRNHEVIFWSDGFDRLGDSSYDGYVRERTKESSGWANLFMGPSSSFVPERGESGPWCWAPAGGADVVCGGGLPARHHVSTFVVWQAVRREDLEQPPVEPGKPVEPEEPAEPDRPVEPPPPPPVITRRLGDWVAPLNVRIRTLDERPDAAQQSSAEIVYILKDLFTTRDGSWEPTNIVGSVNQWARDAYLRPWGAPDYFDDAGADHHLFAAVIGLDGQLLREQEVMFWSDGFDKLGDASYQEYVYRQTKSHSGWANIITGPGANYVPERGESGPWCWAPVGAAEVVCGGGMPAKQHISFFAVWQAVRREDLQPTRPPQPSPGDYNIWLPVVGGGQARGVEAAPAPAATVTPFDPLALTSLALVRAAAWNRLGIEFRPDSPLAEYARRNALGMPVTQEFVSGALLAQGFQGGIVYAPAGEREAVRHMSW